MTHPLTLRSSLVALAAVAGLAAGPESPAQAAPRTAVVISTASVNGEIKSCGCEKKDIGGISRRASVIKAERAQNPAVLLVDAGDFGSHGDVEPWMLTRFQWDMMRKLKYDVVTPGPNEMIQGLGPLQALLAQAPEIKVVSANVTDKAGKRLWPDYAIVERGGVKYGVTGVTDRSFYTFNMSKGLQAKDEFAFEDLRASLNRVLPELRPKVDVVVLLLHTGSGDAARILESVKGVDVAIVGHNPAYKFLPERMGGVPAIQSGNRGQYVNVLELTLDGGKVAGFAGEARPLGDTVKPDPELDPVVEAFHKKFKAAEKAAKASRDQESDR